MAGWIEIQFIADHLDEGIGHLHHALELAPEWPSAIAAYGVAVRRRALQSRGDERESMLVEAETHLRRALALNPSLLDLNYESFWGPIAGILRDRGESDKAIAAYERACQVTPGSSYPHGNLAALYLRKGKEEGKAEWFSKALALFRRTAHLAEFELSMIPNDYFHIMDIAMSQMMLTQHEPDGLDGALEKLDEALGVQPTPEMLTVSRRGWQFLAENCPDDWTDLRAHLSTALKRITEAIETARTAAERQDS